MKAVNLKIMVFRHVTPCCVLRRNQRFWLIPWRRMQEAPPKY